MSDRKSKVFTVTVNGNGVIKLDAATADINLKVRAMTRQQARAHVANVVLAVEPASTDELIAAGRENQTIIDATGE